MYHKSPYIYRYLPEIIDFYPQNLNLDPGIAMFCFPNGIHIKNICDMPYWFNIILTDESGNRSYGACLNFWEECSNDLLESFVPIFDDKKNKYYVEKSLLIISNYPFFYNCRIFLRELYRIQVSSSTPIPLERAICCFVDQLVFQSLDKILTFNIAEEKLNFYRIPIYGSEWDTNNECIETLFSVLGYEQIITLWEGVLLEKKIILLCSSKCTLGQICLGIISLLFPFKYYHTIIPILPEKLIEFLDSPMPIIVGINYPINLNDLPHDFLILNVDNNSFQNYYDKIPKLPNKLNNLLLKKLNKIKGKYNLDNPIKAKERMDFNDNIKPLIDEDEKKVKINVSEIRDIFYDVFIHMFKNYEKYFNLDKKEKKKNKEEQKEEEEGIFILNNFLKDHSSLDSDSFLSKFSETVTFNQFIYSFEDIKQNDITDFFLYSIKKGRGKFKVYLPENIPSMSTICSEIKIDDLEGKSFFYPSFPRLNPKYYIKTEKGKKIYKSRFIYSNDEWCYDCTKLSNKDWANYLFYTIYEIWFNFFSTSILLYDDKTAVELMNYGISLIQDLIEKKKITPSKNLFTKVIKSCARASLSQYVKPLNKLVNLINKKKNNYSSLFYNAFLNGFFVMSDNINKQQFQNISNSLLNKSIMQNVINLLKEKDDRAIEELINKSIFLSYELCPFCLKYKENPKKINIEEILAGFSRGKSDFKSTCPKCLNKIFPKLYYISEDQTNLEPKTAKFFSPLVLVKEVDNIIKNNTDYYFYTSDFYNDKYQRDIFWNLNFYFQLLDLPVCVLYIEKRPEKLEEIISLLHESTTRRITKKKTNKFNNGDKLNDTVKKLSSTSNDIGALSIHSGFTNLNNYEMEILKRIQINLEKNSKNIVENGEKIGSEDRGELNSRIYDMRQIMNKSISYFISSSKEKLNKFFNSFENRDISRINDYIGKETIKFNHIGDFSNIQIENKFTSFKDKDNNNKEEKNDFKTPEKNINTIDNNQESVLNEKINEEDLNKLKFSEFKLENINEVSDKKIIPVNYSNNNKVIKSLTFNKKNNNNNIDNIDNINKKNDIKNFTLDNKNEDLKNNNFVNTDNKQMDSNLNEGRALLSTKPFLFKDNTKEKFNPADIFRKKKGTKKTKK